MRGARRGPSGPAPRTRARPGGAACGRRRASRRPARARARARNGVGARAVDEIDEEAVGAAWRAWRHGGARASAEAERACVLTTRRGVAEHVAGAPRARAATAPIAAARRARRARAASARPRAGVRLATTSRAQPAAASACATRARRAAGADQQRPSAPRERGRGRASAREEAARRRCCRRRAGRRACEDDRVDGADARAPRASGASTQRRAPPP